MPNSPKMTIVAPFGDQRGGAERAMVDFLRINQQEPVVDVDVVFLVDGPLVSWTRSQGYSVSVLDAGRLRGVARYSSTVWALRRHLRRRQPDWVLSWMAKAHLYVGPAAASIRLPALWWQHGISQKSWMDGLATAVPAAGVVCCSRVSELAQQQLRPRRKTRVVYPAVDLDAFTALDEGERRGDDAVVGIVARLQRWKGIHVFLQAAQMVHTELPKARFVVVGGAHFSEPNYPNELKALARSLGIEAVVEFAGHQEDVPQWMGAMDVVVHASTSPEPLGMVILEAMAMGKPVIASDAGGPREVIRHGENGLLTPPGDARALAEAVLEVLRDENLRKHLGERGRETARQFDVRGFPSALVQACRSLVGV
jgi:glycosyltransferase involved in cell wall biosynthesis